MKKINFFSKQGEVLGNGSKIKLAHVLTRNFLHSHPIKYDTGSKQQEVTAFWQRDESDWWIIKGPKQIKNGDKVILTHEQTGKNLHSQKALSPTTEEQEVSAFGSSGKGDTNDYFKVIITQSYVWNNNKVWKVGDIVRFIHINTGVFLHSHDAKTKVSKQQEVTGSKVDDMSNEWTVVEKFAD